MSFAVVMCPVITDIEHAEVIGTEVTYTSSVVIACDTGYELSDDVSNVTVTCLSTGEWSGNISGIECSSKVIIYLLYGSKKGCL